MYVVYILYSRSSGRTYTGFSNNVARRLIEHNVTEKRGFTLRYRPWELMYTEEFDTKKAAKAREDFFKGGKGREEIRRIVAEYLNGK